MYLSLYVFYLLKAQMGFYILNCLKISYLKLLQPNCYQSLLDLRDFHKVPSKTFDINMEQLYNKSLAMYPFGFF